MKHIEQKVKHCNTCNKQTLHYKNSSKINWLLHIFLVIVTAGVWIIPFLLIVILGANVWDSEKFVCSSCVGN